jgi:hypothetical protein
LSQDSQRNRERKEHSPNGGCRGGVKLGQLKKISKQSQGTEEKGERKEKARKA